MKFLLSCGAKLSIIKINFVLLVVLSFEKGIFGGHFPRKSVQSRNTIYTLRIKLEGMFDESLKIDKYESKLWEELLIQIHYPIR